MVGWLIEKLFTCMLRISHVETELPHPEAGYQYLAHILSPLIDNCGRG